MAAQSRTAAPGAEASLAEQALCCNIPRLFSPVRRPSMPVRLGARTLALSLVVPVALPCAVVAAHAEDALVEETIRVVDTRRAYLGDFTQLETPQAAQVIDELAMDRAGVRSLDEALDLSASVARQNNFGGLWNSFAIRGFVGDENLPSGYL
ncbi:MAG: Plug domain-containing protein, partial [Pseudomonadales bacterium]|nr:Plug domain-containing protein [Pseudomonadales bacterium]